MHSIMPDTDVFGGHSSQKIGGSPKHNPVDRTLDGGVCFPVCPFFFSSPQQAWLHTHNRYMCGGMRQLKKLDF